MLRYLVFLIPLSKLTHFLFCKTAADLDLAGDLAKLSSLAAAAPLPTAPKSASRKPASRPKKAMTLNDSFIDLPIPKKGNSRELRE